MNPTTFIKKSLVFKIATILCLSIGLYSFIPKAANNNPITKTFSITAEDEALFKKHQYVLIMYAPNVSELEKQQLRNCIGVMDYNPCGNFPQAETASFRGSYIAGRTLLDPNDDDGIGSPAPPINFYEIMRKVDRCSNGKIISVTLGAPCSRFDGLVHLGNTGIKEFFMN
ncbi:hypothetical protein TPENAI_70460 [Tenacibaculum litopenaei]|uniref:hypothetical protein n=1 Tax=Tenacibaculum litopenaei TaxID=396016 RepID=UPI0038961CA7